MNRLHISLAFAVTAALSYVVVSAFVPIDHGSRDDPPASTPSSSETWTCSMHPDVVRHGSGTCPICGMALVKLAGGETVPHADQVHVSPSQQRHIGLMLQKIEPQPLSSALRLPGQVVVDERGEVTLAPKVEGWIRQLGVAGVGQAIRRGQVLFEIYSPDLQQRQRDYLDLLTRRDAFTNRPGGMAVGNAAPEAMMASIAKERFRARARLAAADVPEDILSAIDNDRHIREWIPVRAERDGVLTSLNAREGSSVSPGQPVLAYSARLAGAVELTLTPEQLGRLPAGTSVTVTSSIDPGQRFAAKLEPHVALIDPSTRLARLRLPLPPSVRREAFLPGSSVQAVIDGTGPQVISVPSDAVLRNGSGDYVVVADGADHFRAVAITPGAEVGERIEVRAGLVAGQEIVVNGQFLIGAEASWQAARARQAATSAFPTASGHHHGH